MTLTIGSLFAGIGGLELGLERTGMQVKWQVENDEFCQRVLTKHWPDVPKFGDIRELTGHEIEPVDLICGGFPCQDISNAGKRAGIEGEQSGLWRDMHRIIRVVRPRYVLVENVSALLVRGLDIVLRDLAESGYDAEWDCIPAAAVGAPHIRDRVFILAYPTSVRRIPLTNQREFNVPRRSRSTWGSVISRTGASGRVWPFPDGTIYRVADGVPSEVDRLRALGNAVVPQVAEWIGRQIVEYEAAA